MMSAKETLIVSMFCLSFLQGVFTLLLGILLYFAVSRNRLGRRRNWPGLVIIGVMYLASSTRFFMTFHQNLKTFGRGLPKHGISWAKFELVQVSIELFGCLMADSLLTWRTWIVYRRDWSFVIFPVCLTVALAVSSAGFVRSSYVGIKQLPADDLQAVLRQARLHPVLTWAMLTICISTVTNVFLTVLLATKLLMHHRAMRATLGFSTLVFESLVIVESGALYSVAWVVYLILFFLDHNASVVVLGIISQLAGIAPTLIIVLVSAGLSPVSQPVPPVIKPHDITFAQPSKDADIESLSMDPVKSLDEDR
ncbi:hypothetical protein HGRIS_008590 [Hohenbuehelia grisea]|uniref:Uncharacterized protein n=1 Tax=Hohenbuehelia grisea TaxID=104357 RepID=A0ABR3J8Z7_9AGAR